MMKKKFIKLRMYALIVLMVSLGAASCRSRAIPCPSFSSITKAEGHQLGHGEAIDYDRHGRVKK